MMAISYDPQQKFINDFSDVSLETINRDSLEVFTTEQIIDKAKQAALCAKLNVYPEDEFLRTITRQLVHLRQNELEDERILFYTAYEVYALRFRSRFKYLNEISDNRLRRYSTAVAKNFPLENRYPDVLPYDDNRSTCHEGRYLNMSPVILGSKIYYITQAPKENTIDKFFHFIIENYKIKAIVTLSAPLGKGEEFWNSDLSRKYENHEIKFIQEEILEIGRFNQKIVKRNIQIIKNNEKIRNLFHYQVIGWPDMGVLEPDLFKKLISLTHPINGDFVVHCSAGIGRSGTFALAHHLYTYTNAVDIEKTLLLARIQRAGLVQRLSQYRLIVDTFHSKIT